VFFHCSNRGSDGESDRPSRVSTATGSLIIGVRIGKSAQQYRVHGAKDGAIGTDAKREYEPATAANPRLL